MMFTKELTIRFAIVALLVACFLMGSHVWSWIELNMAARELVLEVVAIVGAGFAAYMLYRTMQDDKPRKANG
jgi:multisubunit Na+/H+ antiporter MnhG subunit